MIRLRMRAVLLERLDKLENRQSPEQAQVNAPMSHPKPPQRIIDACFSFTSSMECAQEGEVATILDEWLEQIGIAFEARRVVLRNTFMGQGLISGFAISQTMQMLRPDQVQTSLQCNIGEFWNLQRAAQAFAYIDQENP